MAIRDITKIESETIKITIELNNGNSIGPGDITSQTFGSHQQFVSIWINNQIYIYPLNQVFRVIYSFDKA